MSWTPKLSKHHSQDVADGRSLQVICLGSSGGPSEDNASGFLIRSTATAWSPGSVLAVDAGSHLASITRILANDLPQRTPRPITQQESTSSHDSSLEPALTKKGEPIVLSNGAFAGLPFPYSSAKANGLHIVRQHVATYLITHPHLDHLAGFAINTAAFHNTSKPKRLAALPFTVSAIKQHIFNDVVWPNLTDEDNGVGFVSFQRLTEGGNDALGEGLSRGYIEVCNGLSTKGFRVSHGTCASRPSLHLLSSHPSSRRASLAQKNDAVPQTCLHTSMGHAQVEYTADAALRRHMTFSIPQPSSPSTNNRSESQDHFGGSTSCVVDSSAFFIRDEHSGKEILFWGDVEPDAISLLPRNHIVWTEAASKIVRGILGAIFIECSYDDSQPDNVLFGHLAPRHVIAELSMLADLVSTCRSSTSDNVADQDDFAAVPVQSAKRKRHSGFDARQLQLMTNDLSTSSEKRRPHSRLQHEYSMSLSPGAISSPHSGIAVDHATDMDSRNVNSLTATSAVDPAEPEISTPPPSKAPLHASNAAPNRPVPSNADQAQLPLHGLRVVIIHVKDRMQDGPSAEDIILGELTEHETQLQAKSRGLGCEFLVSRAGESYWI